MNILFTLAVALLFTASLYFASWTSSIVCSLLLLLIIWTRLFSNRIIKNDFKNLIHIKNTPQHHLNVKLRDAFVQTADVPKPEIFVDPSSRNLQIYCFGSKAKPQLITSQKLLDKVSTKDLHSLFDYAGVLHNKKIFSRKQNFIALLIYVGNLGRYVDSGLSFVLGIKTESGEPKALTRKPLYFILNKLNQLTRYKKNTPIDVQLQNYSYLSLAHTNPALSPLSVADKIL